MTVSTEFVEIVKIIDESIELPLIKELFIPSDNSPLCHTSNFGAIRLENDIIGVIYLNLSTEIKDLITSLDVSKYKGISPIELAKKFDSSNELEKTFGLGAINAISQHVFRESQFNFDYTTDSMGLLNLKKDDVVGMVGFFPPLVKRIEKMDKVKLIVIEKKEELVKKTPKWEVSLDPSRLNECNKVLCTGTTVLNESINDVLSHCKNIEKFSILGPTAGFFPDPLFKKGVDVVGGSIVNNSNLFLELISKNERWGSSSKKYCIQKHDYPGYEILLKEILKRD